MNIGLQRRGFKFYAGIIAALLLLAISLLKEGIPVGATNLLPQSAPTIDSFTPTSGAAGTTVTITGSNFTGATAVTFSVFFVPAASFSVDSDTQITAVVAVGTNTGNGPIRVVSAQGGAMSTDLFNVLESGGGGGISLSPETLDAPIYNQSYSQTITASGGTAPYTFAVTAGALPAGLSLSSSGEITGTPSGPSNSTFTVTATDAASATGSKDYQLTTQCSASGGFIDPTRNIPIGTVGSPYNLTFTGNGCNSPYAFSAVGTLPPGLTLASNGTLSGTPDLAGSYTFTVKAVDAAGFKLTRVYTLIMLGDFQCPDLNFSSPTDIGPSSPAQTTASGDFNGDGILDSVTLDDRSHSALIRLGNGDGTFQAPLSYPTGGSSPSSVTVGDFDRNNMLDLAVSNSASDDISILLGNGGGGIDNTLVFAVGDNPVSIAAGDFGGDGVLDLVTANSGSDNVTVRLGDGFGNFPAFANFSLGALSSPVSVRVLDFNSDGKTDIAVGKGNGVEAVLLNSCSLPSIASFTPASGAVGTTVTITGANFTGVTNVSFNGTSAAFIENSDTEIAATVPAGATTGKISVTNAAGTALSDDDFIAAPTVDSFTPSSGAIGASVTITGLNFANASSVKFNGSSATFNIDSDTQIAATVPAGATTGKISVTNPAGTALSATDFIVTQPPTVASFTPASARVGQPIEITGANFTLDDPNTLAHTMEVKFNGANALSFSVFSATRIIAAAPEGGTTGKISVTTAGGTALSAADFIYTPSVNAFTPTTQLRGGVVTVTGFNLKVGAANPTVRVNDGNPATVLSSSATEIVFVVPLAATTGKISVTTADGTGVSFDDLIVNPTSFTVFDPAFGPIGAAITLFGTGLDNVTEVKFNGVSASFTLVPNDASPANPNIRAIVPAGATTGLITLTNSVGTITHPTVFKVTPRIDSFTPTTVDERSLVTITGLNLTVGDQTPIVQVGGAPGVVTSATETQINFAAPDAAADFTATIVVITADGSGESAGSLTVIDAIAPNGIASFSPESAPIGATVTILPTSRFDRIEAVTFNGANGRISTSINIGLGGTKIDAVVPAGATNGPIGVTNVDGTAFSTFDFRVAPRVDSFTPASTLAGEDTVTITGLNLKFGSETPSVVINNNVNSVVSVISSTETQLVFSVPSDATTGKIRVTISDGAGRFSSGESSADLIVRPKVEIFGFNPTSAPAGATITIVGKVFTGTTAVKFNGVSASSFTIVSDTHITAVAPAGGSTGPITVETAQNGNASHATNFKYAPRIDGFTPNNVLLGEAVTITGLNLKVGAANPLVEMTAADSGNITFPAPVVSATDTQIVFTVPTGARSGKIRVTTADGASISANDIVLVVLPTIAGIDPASAPVGATILFSTGVLNPFVEITEVKFNGVSASFNVISELQISAVVPAGATTGSVTVTNRAGTGDKFFQIAPRIDGFTPSSQPIGGIVEINGLNLQVGGAFPTVTINNVPAPGAFGLPQTETKLFVHVPNTSTGKIRVTTADGTGISAADLIVPAPQLTAFSPTIAAEDDTVELFGNNFNGVTEVKFNGTTASFNIISNTRITTVVPHLAANGPITVTSSAGTATSLRNFTVLTGEILPTIFTFAPGVGAGGAGFTEGTQVLIYGKNLVRPAPFLIDVKDVKFNGVSADFSTVPLPDDPLGEGYVVAYVPEGATTGKISITTALFLPDGSGGVTDSSEIGTAVSANDFIVLQPPTVASFTPSSGQVGTTVFITGTNLAFADNVTFSGIPADNVFVISNTQISAKAPSGTAVGPIAVTNLAGTGTSASNFTTVNTTAGSNVVVPLDNSPGELLEAKITFSNVVSPGTTSLTISNSAQGQPPLPSGFKIGDPPTYFDLSTTASFTGTARVCLTYSGMAFSSSDALNLRLYHYENGQWVVRTQIFDFVNKWICGDVTSFSPFVILEPSPTDPTATVNIESAFHVPGQGGTIKTPLELEFKVFDRTVVGLPNPEDYGTVWSSPSNTPVAGVSIEDMGDVPAGGGMARSYKILVPPSSAAVGSSGYLVIGKAVINTGTTTAAVYVGSPTGPLDAGSVTSLPPFIVVHEKVDTAVSLSSSPNPSLLGQSATFTATVSSSQSSFTGSVAFFDGANSLGSLPLASGQATLTTSSLSAGSHSITAVYSGDDFFKSSTSNVLNHIVNCPPITITAPSNVTKTTGAGAGSCTAFVSNAELGTAASSGGCTVNVTRTGVPSGNLFPIGTTTITYTGTDASGNVATATQTVTVADNTLPTIAAPPAVFKLSTSLPAPLASVSLGTPTTGDNCSVASVTNNAPANFPAGTTTVTWTVTDSSGNIATAVQTVRIVPAAKIEVVSSVYTIGLQPPFLTIAPLNLSLKVFDHQGRVFIPNQMGETWEGGSGITPPTASITGPTSTSLGIGSSNLYTMLVPSNHSANANLSSGRYITVGKGTVNTTTVYVGEHNLVSLPTGVTARHYLQVIVTARGKIIPCKTTDLTGSLLLLVEPAYLDFVPSEDELPVIYQSVEGNWSSTVEFTPPEGFTSEPNSLSATVDTNQAQVLQFTVRTANTGSQASKIDALAEGGVKRVQLTHRLRHKGETKTLTSEIEILQKKLDIAAANFTPNGAGSVSLMAGNGDGSFGLPTSTTGSGPGTFAIDGGDFNNDGKRDIVAANFGDSNSTSKTLTIFFGDGKGNFPINSTVDAAPQPVYVVAAHLNRDRNLDLAVACRGGSTGAGKVAILLGNGDGTFKPAVLYNVGNEPLCLAVGFLNSDLSLDIAVTSSQDAHGVRILKNKGDGSFTVSIILAFNATNTANPIGVAIFDFNQDQKLDIAVANSGTNTKMLNEYRVTVAYGNGLGNFSKPKFFRTGIRPYGISAGYFDNNLSADIVVSGGDNPSEGNIGKLAVLLNNGEGMLTAQPHLQFGRGIRVPRVGFFNNDSKPDIAVDSADGNVYVLLGNGAGGFTVAPYSAGSNPTQVTIGEFNSQ